MTASYHLTHLHLSDASANAIAAYWVDGSGKCYRVEDARNRLLQALAACEAGTGPKESRAALIDLIATAIIDSTDIDCTSNTQAEAVLAAILDNCLPMPRESK